ncbi:hypothetical protein HK098_002950 [Nowakowskiella sp. JEL0407]|nr:hypothetical protein HK098_002950 [Nowakowskiella sp. JEL0407]
MKRLISLSAVFLCLVADGLAADVCTYEAKGEIILSNGCTSKTPNSNGEFISNAKLCGFLVNIQASNFCTDLTKFDRVEFDVLAPSGSTAMITLVSHSKKDKDCGGSEDGTLYSGYPLILNDLIVDKSTYQHITIPFKDLDNTTPKLRFDLIDGLSIGVFQDNVHKFKNFVFKGGCTGTSASPKPSLKGEWEFCTSNSECANKCCSKEYSGDGKFKCTPNGSRCTGTQAPVTKTIKYSASPAAATSLPMNLGEWQFCSSSKQCLNKCCSKEYSGDGKYKCTPGSSRCI